MNAPNFAALMNQKGSEVKAPVALPEGTYYGIVQKYEQMTSAKKKTPGVQFTVQLTHADEDVDMSEYEADQGKPLAERTIANNGTTFWISENSLFMLKNFIESCGIAMGDRSFAECVPQCVSQPVVLSITREPNQDGTNYFNQVTKLAGMHAATT